jgi:DNA-binding SARP family transcriptional activator
MAHLQLNLLGGIEIANSLGEPVSVPCRKAAMLLAYLALNSCRPVTRSTLAALFWEYGLEEHARASLRQVLLVLRRVLPQSNAMILADRDDIRLLPAMISTDVEAFERLLTRCQPDDLNGATALYRGELLDGIAFTSARFEAWLAAERQRLKSLAIAAAARLIEVGGDSERIDSGIALALRILTIDPLQEALHRTLIRCYLRLGRRGDALRQYALCSRALWHEARATPETETEQLHRDILRQTGLSSSPPRQYSRTHAAS